MNQEELELKVQDYLDGRLSDAERAGFEVRLESDPELARRIEEYRRIGGILRETEAVLPPGFVARARARFEAEHPERRRWFRPLSWESLGLSAAALLLAFLFIPQVFRDTGGFELPPPRPKPAQEERAKLAASEPATLDTIGEDEPSLGDREELETAPAAEHAGAIEEFFGDARADLPLPSARPAEEPAERPGARDARRRVNGGKSASAEAVASPPPSPQLEPTAAEWAPVPGEGKPVPEDPEPVLEKKKESAASKDAPSLLDEGDERLRNSQTVRETDSYRAPGASVEVRMEAASVGRLDRNVRSPESFPLPAGLLEPGEVRVLSRDTELDRLREGDAEATRSGLQEIRPDFSVERLVLIGPRTVPIDCTTILVDEGPTLRVLVRTVAGDPDLSPGGCGVRVTAGDAPVEIVEVFPDE